MPIIRIFDELEEPLQEADNESKTNSGDGKPESVNEGEKCIIWICIKISLALSFIILLLAMLSMTQFK